MFTDEAICRLFSVRPWYEKDMTKIGSYGCSEAVIPPDDLYEADAVFCGNSVRELVKVSIAGKSK
jgi:hypothetical protein